MRVLKTVAARVLDVAFGPDCRAVAAAVEGPAVFLWNLDSPAATPVQLAADGVYQPGSLRFVGDGRKVRWKAGDGFRHYDRDARSTAHEPFPHLRTAMWWTTNDDATRALSAHSVPDYSLAGWQLNGGEWVRLWQLSTRDLSASNLTLTAAGDRFAMVTRHARAARWWEQPMRVEVRDALTSAELAAGPYPYRYGGRLAFHPHGTQLASVHEMALMTWPIPIGGAPRLVRNADSRRHFTALAYTPSGRHILATSNDETVHVFDAATLDRATRYTWQLDELSAVAVSPDGTLAAAGSAKGNVVVWDLDLLG